LQLNEREQVVGIGHYRLQGRETNYTTLYIYTYILKPYRDKSGKVERRESERTRKRECVKGRGKCKLYIKRCRVQYIANVKIKLHTHIQKHNSSNREAAQIKERRNVKINKHAYKKRQSEFAFAC